MITAILVTLMICLTLLIISKYGINIKIDKNYNHTYKDATSYQTASPENLADIQIDKLIKGQDKKEVDDFVSATTQVFNDYFAQEDSDKKGGNVDG